MMVRDYLLLYFIEPFILEGLVRDDEGLLLVVDFFVLDLKGETV
jgi:hypothetical protein